MTFLKHVGAILTGVIQVLVGGVVLASFWRWFIVPKFASAPTLTFLDAIGVEIAIGFLLVPIHLSIGKFRVEFRRASEGKKPMDDQVVNIILNVTMALVGYPFAYGAAYLWHLAIRAWS